MTVSNRFNFRAARRGLRRTFLGAKREAGSSLFEFAMVLPLLSMLLIGIVYSGITLYDYVALDYAVAIGVRTVANNRGAGQTVVGSVTTNACTMGEGALRTAAAGLGTITIDLVAPETETFVRDPNLVPSVPPVPPSSCAALEPGDTVTMTATYPCNLTIPFVGINLCSVKPGPITTYVPYGSSGTGKISVQTGTCSSSNGCLAATATARIE